MRCREDDRSNFFLWEKDGTQSAEMADVVIGLAGDLDVERRVARHIVGLAGAVGLPRRLALQADTAAACHAFHDFRCAGVEGERGRQDDADRFLRAVGELDAVADALAVEVDAGLGGDGDAVDLVLRQLGVEGLGGLGRGFRTGGRPYPKGSLLATIQSPCQNSCDGKRFIGETFSVFSILNNDIAILAKPTVGAHQKVVSFFFKTGRNNYYQITIFPASTITRSNTPIIQEHALVDMAPALRRCFCTLIALFLHPTCLLSAVKLHPFCTHPDDLRSSCSIRTF